jgi:CheY-like chemotaxis protein
VVACTAYLSSKDMQRAKEIGMVDYITKPVAFDDLEKVIK